MEFHVEKNGLFTTFTEPLNPKAASDPQNWSAERWNYKWQNKYGSQEFSLIDPKKLKHDEVLVEEAHLSSDGKTVWLKCDDLKPVMQMKVQYKIRDTAGEKLAGEKLTATSKKRAKPTTSYSIWS